MQCEQAQVNHNIVMESSKNSNGGKALSPRAVSNLSLQADALIAEVDAKVDRIFAEADVNNDGAISHAEFLWVMTGLDFHLLEKLGVPVEGGFSARDTFLYNTKLNNSYDSAIEDWNRDIDQHFEDDDDLGFSPKTNNPYGLGSSLHKSTSSTATSSHVGITLQGQLSFTNYGKNQGASQSSLAEHGGAQAASPLGGVTSSREGSAKNRRFIISRPINSPPLSSRGEGPAVPLDTHIELPGVGNSSSSGDGGGGGGAGGFSVAPPERPSQRQSRRQRDVQLTERVETPPSYKGILAKNAVFNDFFDEPQVCFLHKIKQCYTLV